MSVGYTWVQWTAHKKIYDTILFIGIIAYIGVFFVVSKLTWSGLHAMSDEIILIRALGSLAIILLHVILLIGPLARLDTRFLPLLYNRRHLGVATFLIALMHGSLAFVFYMGFSMINPVEALLTSNTEFDSVTQFPFELLGVLALIILFYMAATSHDFWNNMLGRRGWKALHMSVYLAYALLIGHVALGFLQKETHPAYAATLGFGALVVIGAHVLTGVRESRRDKRGTAAAEEWIDVANVSDIPDTHGKVVCLKNDERIAIFRHNDTLSAVTNVCRHQAGPLGEGRIIDGCITCPWHGWQYRPEDGRSPPPFEEKIETYELRVEGERVLVNPRANPPGTLVAPAPIGSSQSNGDAEALYVGYRAVPPRQRKFLRVVVPSMFVLLVALAGGAASLQQDPGDGQWLVGETLEIGGVISERPYPMLIVDDTDGAETILLVGTGKYAAQVEGRDGQHAVIRGAPITRHGVRLLEVADDPNAITVIRRPAPTYESQQRGPVTLVGEIVDPKCYFGAMKPGYGKTHKACAILCIRGGIPPVFAAAQSDGTPAYYLIADADGNAANEYVIPHIGERVTIEGRMTERGGMRIVNVEAIR